MLLRSSVFSSSRRYRFSSVISVDTSVIGTLPVLDGERVQRQDLDAEPGGRLDDVADRFDAGAMALDPRQVSLRGPAAVAVHDDGDVLRQPVEIHLSRKRLLGRPGRHDGKNVLKRHEC